MRPHLYRYLQSTQITVAHVPSISGSRPFSWGPTGSPIMDHPFQGLWALAHAAAPAAAASPQLRSGGRRAAPGEGPPPAWRLMGRWVSTNQGPITRITYSSRLCYGNPSVSMFCLLFLQNGGSFSWVSL